MFADIIIDISHEKLDKIFQYRIPERLEGRLRPGMEVLVPFGKGNHLQKGYVTGISEECQYDLSKIKELHDISGTGVEIEGRLVALAAWMKENYGGTMIQSLRTVLPVRKKEKAREKKKLRLLLDRQSGEEKLAFYLEKNQRARARLLAALLDSPVLDYEIVTKELKLGASVVRALEEQGVARLESEQVYRNPAGYGTKAERTFSLNAEQKQVLSVFQKDREEGQNKTYLLYGVTGSGKTEVYIEMIRQVVEQGKQAIVLIPEIALTYQTVQRFRRCFGERVSILNSRLLAGEKYDQLMRAKKGDIDVMIGPRSALFTPFPDLGLIVVDEEHEPAYKSEQVPRYHARETAVQRAQMEGASVVLGSATPSLEAMYRAKKGEYTLLEMKNRTGMHEMAKVYTVDLREELRQGNRTIFSRLLQEKIEQRLDAGEQVMLFLNRRGYSGFLSCRECGHVVKCPHCSVSLSVHKGSRMVCHYCGYERPKVSSCPECGSSYIGEFRAGTQQVEEQVKKMFPQARVLRMDLDTTKKKDAHAKLLASFGEGKADILVGTQMIVKGHDFPNVTLVGVLAADLSLHNMDYHSAERTFQLLTQAEGRAGRGVRQGEAVLQTYDPEHYAIRAASAQDYEAFYRQEIAFREMMGYPPAEHLLVIHVSCVEESLLETACEYLRKYIDRVLQGSESQVIGPARPYVDKIKDVYLRVIYVKEPDIRILTELKDWIERYAEMNKGFEPIRMIFDFDPV